MRTTGTVKWFDEIQGRGVIARDDGEGECSVDVGESGGFAPLRGSQRVAFEVVPTPEGSLARNISLIRSSTGDGSRPRVEIGGSRPRRLLRSSGRMLRFGRL